MGTSLLSSLDRTAWLRQHETVWAAHASNLPTDACLSFTQMTATARWGQLGVMSMAEPERAWSEIIEPAASKGNSIYVGAAVRRPGTTSQGTAADVLCHTALVADLDVASGAHKSDTLPTNDQVIGWAQELADMGVNFQLVSTGGGYHLWAPLAEPINVQDRERGQEIYELWRRYWLSLGKRDSVQVDKTPLANPALVLRVAGTINAKYGTPVTLARKGQRNRALGFAELAALAAVTPEPEKKHAAAASPSFTPATGVALDTNDRPGDRFNNTIPVADLAAALLDAESDGPSMMLVPWVAEDGSLEYPETANASIYVGERGFEKLKLWGSSISTQIGQDKLSPFEILAYAVRRAGYADDAIYSRAARLAKGFDGDIDTLVAQASLGPQPSAQLLPAVGKGPAEPAAVIVPTEEGVYPDAHLLLDSEASALAETTITPAQALAERLPAEFELDGDIVVRMNGGGEHGHGVFRRRAVHEDGKFVRNVYDQVTSWVPLRTASTVQMKIDGTGRSVEVDTQFTVAISRADGRTKSRDGFDKASSVSPKAIADALDAGVALPIDTKQQGIIGNVLRTLGHDEIDESSEYGSLGWLLDSESGKHVYLAPAGSVTAEGPDASFTVTAPPGSEDAALNGAQEALGYPNIPQDDAELRKVAEAIPAFREILPNRLDASTALLGVLFAAPLALSGRTSVGIVAKPGVGKSYVSAAAQSFTCPVYDGKTYTGGLLLEDTATAINVKSSWARHSTLVFDDFKATGDPKRDSGIRNNVIGVITQAFGGTGRSTGTRAGGLQSAKTAQNCAIWTGEGTPDGEGFVSRFVRVELEEGDVALKPMGQAPYDRFREQHAPRAHELFGAYLQWLAARLDQIGLPAFTRENDAEKGRWLTRGAGRTAETIATLAVGWVRLREFANARGFEDLLPTQDVVDAALDQLAGANTELVGRSNPARTIIDAARDAIQSRRWYLDLASEATPTGELARYLGWINPEPNVWRPGRDRLGALSLDGQSVVLTGDAIRRFQIENGLGSTPKDQLARAAQELVVEGTVPGDRSPRAQFPARNRGWMIPASMLDLDLKWESATAASV